MFGFWGYFSVCLCRRRSVRRGIWRPASSSGQPVLPHRPVSALVPDPLHWQETPVLSVCHLSKLISTTESKYWLFFLIILIMRFSEILLSSGFFPHNFLFISHSSDFSIIILSLHLEILNLSCNSEFFLVILSLHLLYPVTLSLYLTIFTFSHNSVFIFCSFGFFSLNWDYTCNFYFL